MLYDNVDNEVIVGLLIVDHVILKREVVEVVVPVSNKNKTVWWSSIVFC
jgi:hypothetical protein